MQYELKDSPRGGKTRLRFIESLKYLVACAMDSGVRWS
jgi:hypothetical protein